MISRALHTLVLGALLLWTSVAAAEGKLRVHFLDIGQGDAALIVSPTGKTVLVDAGPRGGDRVVRHALASEGHRGIDLAVFTHAHADHIGGMIKVIESVPVKRVLDPGYDHTSATYQTLLATMKKHKVPVYAYECNSGVMRPTSPAVRGVLVRGVHVIRPAPAPAVGTNRGRRPLPRRRTPAGPAVFYRGGACKAKGRD